MPDSIRSRLATDPRLAALSASELDAIEEIVGECQRADPSHTDETTWDCARLPGGTQVCERAQLIELVIELTDEDPCWFDHHGYCQAHGWFDSPQEPVDGSGKTCPHGRSQTLMAQLFNGEGGDHA